MYSWKKTGLTVLGVCGLATTMLMSAGTAQNPDGPQHPLRAPLAPNDPNARLDPGLRSVPAIPLPEGKGGRVSPAQGTLVVDYDISTKQAKTSTQPAATLYKAAPGPTNTAGEQGSVPGVAKEEQKRAVIGADNRQKITTTSTYPWRTQCKLYMRFPNGARYMGSGTLIGNKYVLTAGHCIYSRSDGGWATSIEVIPGLNGTYKPYGSAWARMLRSYTGWTVSQSYDHDFGLITLDRLVGNSTGWLGYGYFPTINGTTANLAGYPGDRDSGLGLYYHYGPVQSSTAYQVNYAVDTAPGQSGSGVYKIESNGNRYVFAAHSHSNGAGSTTNGGTRIDLTKFNSIKSWIASGQ